MPASGRCVVLRRLLTPALLLSATFLQPSTLLRAAAQDSQSPQEAQIIYRDAANFQNNGAFDLASEEWERFLKRFPKDPLAAKAQHYLGVCNLQLKDYAKAAGAFQTVVNEHPKFEAIQDSYLNLGWCQYTLGGQGVEGMYAKSAETFTALLKNHPDGKYSDQALFFLAEAEYHQGRKKEATESYAKLVAAHPSSPLRNDALYALGVSYEELGQYAKAGSVYDTFLKEATTSPLAGEVRMRKAETILQAGEYAEAAELFAQVAAEPDFASADHALYRQAFCLSKLDQFAKAAELYAKIATDYPRSAYASEAALSAGRGFYRADQTAEATKWFQVVLDRGGKDAPEAAHWLCRLALKQGQPKRVLELTEQLLPAAQDSEFLVQLKMDRGDALYESADGKAESLATYAAIAEEHAQHELAPQARYNAAFAALELKQYDQAISHADAFLKTHPDHRLAPDVRYVAAESQLQLSRHAEAEQAYRELLEGHAEHPDADAWQVRLAVALYLQKDYAAVVAELQPLLERLQPAGTLAEAHYLIGASHFYQDQHKPAIAALAASLKAAPQWRQADEATLLLSRALQADGQGGEAIKTVEQLISGFPNSEVLDQAHFRYGEYAYAATDYETAQAQYVAVLEGWPKSAFAPFALYGQGWSQLKTGQHKPAIASFTTLITEHPKHQLVPESHFARAICRRQAGQHEGVIQDVDEFLKSEPELANKLDALYERGLAEIALKRPADAAATLEKLLQENPQYAAADKVLYELAWARKSMAKPEEQTQAIPVFARLAKDFPASPLAAEAHFHVAEALYDEAKYQEAAAEYEAAKAKAEGPDLGEKSRYKLGWSRFQQRQYQEALDEFTAQAEKYPAGPLVPDARFMIAECLYRLEKYDQALPAYLAANELKLPSPTIAALALLHGGQSASQLKQWDQAIELFQRLLETQPDSPYLAETYYELAFAQQNDGQQDEALKSYEQAADRSQGAVGARARFMIGEACFGNKQYADAIRHFQRVMFGFGGEAAPEDVKPWQAKAAFEAARCAEVQIQDAPAAARPALIADAKKFYQHVVDKHAASELVAQAEQRLQALSKL